MNIETDLNIIVIKLKYTHSRSHVLQKVKKQSFYILTLFFFKKLNIEIIFQPSL